MKQAVGGDLFPGTSRGVRPELRREPPRSRPRRHVGPDGGNEQVFILPGSLLNSEMQSPLFKERTHPPITAALPNLRPADPRGEWWELLS